MKITKKSGVWPLLAGAIAGAIAGQLLFPHQARPAVSSGSSCWSASIRTPVIFDVGTNVDALWMMLWLDEDTKKKKKGEKDGGF